MVGTFFRYFFTIFFWEQEKSTKVSNQGLPLVKITKYNSGAASMGISGS